MHGIACNEIYYIVLQIHYMSLHSGGFADAILIVNNIKQFWAISNNLTNNIHGQYGAILSTILVVYIANNIMIEQYWQIMCTILVTEQFVKMYCVPISLVMTFSGQYWFTILSNMKTILRLIWINWLGEPQVFAVQCISVLYMLHNIKFNNWSCTYMQIYVNIARYHDCTVTRKCTGLSGLQM